MSRRPERLWARLLAGYVAFAGLLILATAPAYLFVEAQYRPRVIRLAATLFVGGVLVHVTKAFRARLDQDTASASESVPSRGSRLEPRLDRQFLALHDEIRFSLRSRRHFDHVLWPRLCALADRPGAEPPPKPAGRHFKRGPSVRALGDLLATIEGRG